MLTLAAVIWHQLLEGTTTRYVAWPLLMSKRANASTFFVGVYRDDECPHIFFAKPARRLHLDTCTLQSRTRYDPCSLLLTLYSLAAHETIKQHSFID